MKEHQPKPRTSQQNRALHLFCQKLADELNAAGLDMKLVLKPHIKIPWTKTSVKEHLWKPIQKAMYNKESTTQLDKQLEIDHIHEVLMRELALAFHIENIPFPHEDKEAPLIDDEYGK